MNPDLQAAISAILGRRTQVEPYRSVLVGVSGIDASGKGYLSRRLATKLQLLGLHAIHVNVDPWLSLPNVRFSEKSPAEHFYRNAIRFDELFAKLILPLKKSRQVRVLADYTEEAATEYRPHLFEYEDIDVIILEGIYLFQRPYLSYFDLTIWIDCSFETALQRAISRSQEGLSPNDTIRAYETIYFPAQRFHFEWDNPIGCADLIVTNDSTSAAQDLMRLQTSS